MLLNFKSAACILGVVLLELALNAQGQLNLSGAGILKVLGEKQYFVESGVKVSFHRALQLCAKMGMTLASIESSTEENNLRDLLVGNSALSKQFWLSGTDLPLSREFVWFGTGRAFSYTNWASGVRTTINQRCVLTDSNFKWRREFCTNAHYFICEKPVKVECGPNGECISKPLIIY